jgi:hypothetical protein
MVKIQEPVKGRQAIETKPFVGHRKPPRVSGCRYASQPRTIDRFRHYYGPSQNPCLASLTGEEAQVVREKIGDVRFWIIGAFLRLDVPEKVRRSLGALRERLDVRGDLHRVCHGDGDA